METPDSSEPELRHEELKDLILDPWTVPPIWARIAAGIADLVLALIVAGMTAQLWLLPYSGHEVSSTINAYSTELVFEDTPSWAEVFATRNSNPVLFAIFQAMLLLIGSVGLYYFLSDWLLKGASLGKRMFSLRIIAIHTGKAPGPGYCLMRAWIKMLFIFTPLSWFLFLLCFFNQKQLALHDMLCRTRVVG